ncbi:putative oxidoreductase CipA-like protein [Coniochaeta ligniaria NRRL 30616]|uniref:Putative oxidoreductase CipA-like protein n=1 Tax=Coniochaeta ligniaria NRRL 30616 TaxID=1408157 RepID=A0A1J7IA90_9PEZI|nr:putative oxidoreductase CipA-like protein [Coniochaeta ligniaria NRRL 30616]
MTAYNKVALAGATGLMGTPILEHLLQNNFDVTVLTREDSKATFPDSVKVQRVDYSSKESLVSALQGQDAVVSALTHLSIATSEALLIDAAVEAGVKRFIPSEFASDATNPKAASFPLYTPKIASIKRLEAAAKTNPNFTYTSVITGPLLGWVVTQAFINPTDKTAKLYDGGDRVFSVVMRATIGKAVAAVLSHPEDTKNRAVKVHDATSTLRKLLAAVQKAVGEDGWTVSTPSVEEALAGAWAGVKAGRFDFPTIFGFIVAASQGEGYGGELENVDNELLGISVKTDEELQALVEKIVVGADRTGW